MSNLNNHHDYLHTIYIHINYNIFKYVRALSDLALLFKNSIYTTTKIWQPTNTRCGTTIAAVLEVRSPVPLIRSVTTHVKNHVISSNHSQLYIIHVYSVNIQGQGQEEGKIVQPPPPSAPCKNLENGRIGLLKLYSHKIFYVFI